MNKIYFLLKMNRLIRNHRIKSMGIFMLHILKKRYIGVFFDPILACNLRCKMCYFSDPEKRKKMKGVFEVNDLPKIADAFFDRALKLQIGCGAEPSLFPYNKNIIQLAKLHKVPYISMATNANMFIEKNWWELVETGLNEVTLSLHGVTRESYEYFMTGGSYDAFCQSLATLTDIKKVYPNFKIRVNYTVNRDNMAELVIFFDVFGAYNFDILQIRPIQKIGDSEYNIFSWNELYEEYEHIIEKVKKDCAQHGVTCIAPEKKDLQSTNNEDHKIIESTYCYISPIGMWRDDFIFGTDTYNSYAKRTNLSGTLFKNIFRNNKRLKTEYNRLKYSVD